MKLTLIRISSFLLSISFMLMAPYIHAQESLNADINHFNSSNFSSRNSGLSLDGGIDIFWFAGVIKPFFQQNGGNQRYGFTGGVTFSKEQTQAGAELQYLKSGNTTITSGFGNIYWHTTFLAISPFVGIGLGSIYINTENGHTSDCAVKPTIGVEFFEEKTLKIQIGIDVILPIFHEKQYNGTIIQTDPASGKSTVVTKELQTEGQYASAYLKIVF